MGINGKTDTIPLTKEGITEAKWFAPSALIEPLSNTYPNIILVLEKAGLLNQP
jgi:hypothetical protein